MLETVSVLNEATVEWSGITLNFFSMTAAAVSFLINCCLFINNPRQVSIFIFYVLFYFVYSYREKYS